MRARLGEVRAITVRKELTALRSFLDWLQTEGWIQVPRGVQASHVVPKLPKRAAGTPHPKRRRVPSFEIAPEYVRAIIDAMPEWSDGHTAESLPIRAYFVVCYETSLRPSTVQRLRAPKHYRAGADLLQIEASIDKARFARDVPLTDRARKALDATLAELDRRARERGAFGYEGPIFGEHQGYWRHVPKVAAELCARGVLPFEVANRVAGAHLRSAALTHWIDRGVPLTAAQHMAGHKQVSTTAKYVKPSFRAAADALASLERPNQAPSTPPSAPPAALPAD